MADAKDVKAKYGHEQIRSAMTGKEMSWPPERDPKEVSKHSGSRRIFTIKHQSTDSGGGLAGTKRRLKSHRARHQEKMANRSIQAHKDAAKYNAYRAEKGLKPHEG